MSDGLQSLQQLKRQKHGRDKQALHVANVFVLCIVRAHNYSILWALLFSYGYLFYLIISFIRPNLFYTHLPIFTKLKIRCYF